jgi:hypothetical protein
MAQMISLADLLAKREAAGARYAAAVAEFREALVDLAALDGALKGKTVDDIRSFGNFPDVLSLRHPVYAADESGHLQSEATERRNRYLSELEGT